MDAKLINISDYVTLFSVFFQNYFKNDSKK